MKTIEFAYGPRKLHLYFNGSAMFAVQTMDDDRPEDQPAILDRIMEQTPAGVAALCQVAHVLATQGEHCRRYLQYTPERIPPAIELEISLSPVQLLRLRAAVVQAINAGYGEPSGDDDGDIDLGLAELEKKTKL